MRSRLLRKGPKELQRVSEAERDRQLGESEAAREAASHALAFAETGGIED